MKTSKLTLVGAGPGDPELITLKGVNALKSADVVLYDALANEILLEHTSHNCKNIYVGKRFGCHVLSQTEINHLIKDMLQKNNHVVRLKGGDPFVFGRAQEEIETARALGIQVEVVPGISSALAVPASQMIPLTCRGLNESFWVTTGTTRSGEISGDIKIAAQSSATIIILMAMSKLEAIMDIFIGAGKKDIPVAIIENGTTNKERIITGIATDIYFKAQYHSISNPAVIIVGEVVKLHPSILQHQQIQAVSGMALTQLP